MTQSQINQLFELGYPKTWDLTTLKAPAVSLELEFQGQLPWKVRLECDVNLSQYNLILCQFTTAKK